MPDRRDAADREPGQVVRLARGRPADLGFGCDDRQPRDIHPVGPGDEADDRLEAVVLVGGHEDQRLHDLAEFRTDRGGRLFGGVGRLVERDDRQCHALASCGLQDARDSRVVEWCRHGRSLASDPGRTG